MTRLASVSIDLDPLRCYYQIHALGAPPAELATTVLERAVPRFRQLFDDRNILATWFVVGDEIDAGNQGTAAGRRTVSELAAAGHELGNHSYSHPYDLARGDGATVSEEIGRCDEVLRQLTGAPVAGFRAPGYDLSEGMLAELMRRGYLYDSSIFPAPGYYAAKALVMAGLALRRRPSGAVLTNPRALLAPAEPYRPAATRPWRRGQATLVELPIAVTPHLRVPAIGTSLLLAPRWLRQRWLAAMTQRSFFNLELHGIDLCDTELDGIPGELVARQPDLRVPLTQKRQALAEVLDFVVENFQVVRLRDAAQWAQREVA